MKTVLFFTTENILYYEGEYYNNALNAFIDAKDSIYTYKAAELFTKRKSVTVKNTAPASSGKAQYYKVRRGDTLSGIAVKYKTTVSRLRSLNGIKGNRITAGKSIRVR